MTRGSSERTTLLAGVAFFVVALVASIAPIRSYDYFWHLATGRWIAEHHALPWNDPFATASARGAWVNDSWGFDVALHAVYRLGGHAGVSIARAAAIAAFFTLLFFWCTRRLPPAVSAFLCVIAMAGASLRLGTRPEPLGMALLALTLITLFEATGRRRMTIVALLTIAWINVHPSALLAPAVVALAAAGAWIDERKWSREVSELTALVAVSGAALLANPYGVDGVAAPLRLAALVQSGGFVNAEWLPSAPSQFPLLYVVIAAGALLIVFRRTKPAAAALLFLFFALLAMRFVRNQGFFFVALPLLASFWLPPRATPRATMLLRFALATIVAGVFLIRVTHPWRTGPDASYFPLKSVARLHALKLGGPLYNPDQFGGFLIWSFYPERRALTDGRNELYARFNEEYAAARTNNRAWQSLLKRHGVTVAIDEYRREPIRAVDPRSGVERVIAPSVVLYPRRDWALVAFDDVAMVFARRASFPPSLLGAAEYRVIRPDDWKPFDAHELAAASAELARARSELGESKVVERVAERLALSRADR